MSASPVPPGAPLEALELDADVELAAFTLYAWFCHTAPQTTVDLWRSPVADIARRQAREFAVQCRAALAPTGEPGHG